MNLFAKCQNILKKMSALSIALCISLAIHVVILAIKFQPELKKFADNLPTLDVVLVNAKTDLPSKNADTLAQANLDRGGNTDENKKLKSALPSAQKKVSVIKLNPHKKNLKSTNAAATAAPKSHAEKKVETLEQQNLDLMTQLKFTRTIVAHSAQTTTTTQPNIGVNPTPALQQDTNLTNSQTLEIARLEAIISKEQEDYQKRPKRKFIGARTKEYQFATYVESWRQKVELTGNQNYPVAAKQNSLYGQLVMTVSIKANGHLENIVIDKSSGSKILDEAARHIVQLGEPYEVFPEDMHKNVDILSITRTWTFTKEDGLASE